MQWDIQNENLPYRLRYISAKNYVSFKLESRNKPRNEYLFDDTDPSGLRLNLDNVTMNDTGVYSCYVSNFEGSDYALFYLTVQSKETNS